MRQELTTQRSQPSRRTDLSSKLKLMLTMKTCVINDIIKFYFLNDLVRISLVIFIC